MTVNKEKTTRSLLKTMVIKNKKNRETTEKLFKLSNNIYSNKSSSIIIYT